MLPSLGLFSRRKNSEDRTRYLSSSHSALPNSRSNSTDDLPLSAVSASGSSASSSKPAKSKKYPPTVISPAMGLPSIYSPVFANSRIKSRTMTGLAEGTTNNEKIPTPGLARSSSDVSSRVHRRSNSLDTLNKPAQFFGTGPPQFFPQNSPPIHVQQYHRHLQQQHIELELEHDDLQDFSPQQSMPIQTAPSRLRRDPQPKHPHTQLPATPAGRQHERSERQHEWRGSTSGAASPQPPPLTTGWRKNKDFTVPAGLPISPPLSPDSPLGNGATPITPTLDEIARSGKKSENDLLMEIASLKKAVAVRDQIIATKHETPGSDEGSHTQSSTSASANANLFEAQRVNQILSRRIQTLEKTKRDLEGDLSTHSARIVSLRKSHTGVIESMKDAHAQEIASLRKAAKALERGKAGVRVEQLENVERLKMREEELELALQGKEKELEHLRSGNDSYREHVNNLEKLVATKEDEIMRTRRHVEDMEDQMPPSSPLPEEVAEMGLADIGRRLLDEIRRRDRAEKRLDEAVTKHQSDINEILKSERQKREGLQEAAYKDYEKTLQQEENKRLEVQKRAKKDLDYVLSEEEKRRAELNWIFGEKMEKMELMRKAEIAEMSSQLELAKKEKGKMERRMKEMFEEMDRRSTAVMTQRSGNEDLVQMVKKINTRLAEEKKRNKNLENTVQQISEEALHNVSGTKHEVIKLRNELEDKDTRIMSLEGDLRQAKRERDDYLDAWNTLQDEIVHMQQSIDDREERIRDLESESDELRHGLETCKTELQGLRDHVDARDELLSKLSEGSASPPARSSRGGPPSVTTTGEDIDMLQNEADAMREDIALYQRDIKVYRHDVKKRDQQIQGLTQTIQALESQLAEIQRPGSSSSSDSLISSFPDPGTPKLSSPKMPHMTPTLGSSSHTPQTTAPPMPSSTSKQASHLRAENLSLKQKLSSFTSEYSDIKRRHEAFQAQQGIVMKDLETQLLTARREKEAMEQSALRQLKRMQMSFLKLSQSRAPPAPEELMGAVVSPYSGRSSPGRSSPLQHGRSSPHGLSSPLHSGIGAAPPLHSRDRSAELRMAEGPAPPPKDYAIGVAHSTQGRTSVAASRPGSGRTSRERERERTPEVPAKDDVHERVVRKEVPRRVEEEEESDDGETFEW